MPFFPLAGRIQEVLEPSHKSLKDLYAYWLSKKGASPAPPRSAIKPEEMVPLLPNIALADVIGEPPRFRFRVFGTRLVDAYGQDLTGKFTDEIDLGSAALTTDIMAACTKMVRECRAQVVRVQFEKHDGRHLEYERIGLPLSDDGVSVNMLLCAFAFEREFLNAIDRARV